MEDHPNVVRTEDLDWGTESHGDRFAHRRKKLGIAAGNEKLGCSLYEIPPGRRAWPRHYHFANEEALYVLEGEGTVRIGDDELRVSAGDYTAFPAGEANVHQVVNESDGILRYLCFSTMIEPDITGYPDSDKFGLMAGSAPGGRKEKRTLNIVLSKENALDYFEGEE